MQPISQTLSPTDTRPSRPVLALPESWSRVVITGVRPQVDGGRWPVKRAVGEGVTVEAHVIVDGHEKLAVELLYRKEGAPEQVARMRLRYNDEYLASFRVEELGRYTYRVRAWINQFATWQDQFRRRVEGGDEAELASELLGGAELLRKAAEGASGKDRERLLAYAAAFEKGEVEQALDEEVTALARDNDPREGMVESAPYEVVVDPRLALCAAWYEFFPRSAAREPGRHGTLDDAARILPRIKELGFDIVYLPPVHPIGRSFRKGKDNAPEAGPGEPGSPWAIGSEEGGHKSVHPELGGMEAFDRFVARAEELGLKVSIDIAFQTSPDHPYVRDHPEWFSHRPDGTIRYAENPPKKYQDVYPFNFECDDWQALWLELRSVFEFWIEHGITVFRVDNPHTKALPFWEWCFATLRERHPELIFLSEAFTRPKMMYMLAKLGFNNSYTYFTWRNSKQELEEYIRELTQTEVVEFFRPNFWPNTPDILHAYLVHGGRPAHAIRFILAATLSSVYGLYGPPYEHVYNKQHPKREEYADNEKYEIRTWNWSDPNSLQPLIKRVNRIRRDNPALQQLRNVRLIPCDNPQLLVYAKYAEENLVLCIVNVDPFQQQEGWIDLPLDELGIPNDRPYEVYDLLGGEHYYWNGARNYVRLNPHVMPAHLFRVQRRYRTEQDFEDFA